MAAKAAITLLTTTSISTSPANNPMVNSTTMNGTMKSSRWMKRNVPFWDAAFLTVKITGSLESILILAVNLTLLSVILSSPLLRSRMRNHLVISVVIANLIVGILSSPFAVDATVRRKWVHGCYLYVLLILLTVYVQNFVSVWGIVALLLHYLARLLRYEGPNWLGRLPASVQKAVPGLLIASPWIVSMVLLVPLVFGGLHNFVWAVWTYTTCPMVLQEWATFLLNCLSFFIPAVILVVLTVLIIILHRRRSDKRESQSTMETAMKVVPDVGQELETCWVHVLVAVLTILMMGPEHSYLMSRYQISGPMKSIVIASLSVHLLSDLTPLAVALVWLLMLPDVRGRLLELLSKLPCNFHCWRGRSPPDASGNTSIAPVAFRDLHDE